MKMLLLALALLCFALPSLAEDPSLSESLSHFRAEKQDLTPDHRDLFYCQEPSSWWFTINAGTPFDTEMADDFPAVLRGQWFNEIGFYVGEWQDDWQDPLGVIFNIYNGSCPPGLEPFASHYVDWEDLEVEMVYENPGWQTVYWVFARLPETYLIEENMSVGFVVDVSWGEEPPIAGVVMTEEFEEYGNCEAYWDGDEWGSPRWTAVSDAFSLRMDVAYCLGVKLTAVDGVSWGTVKSLY